MAKHTDSELYEVLGKAIYESYTQGIFSKVLKSDTDIKVFHTFLLKNLDAKKILDDGSINYSAVNKDDFYRLSLASRLTESAVQSKFEADFYSYSGSGKTQDGFDLKELIQNQLNQTGVGANEFIKEGKVRLLVANPVVKKHLVNALAGQGFIPDYSFNRDIVSIGVIDVLRILGMTDDDINKNLFDAVIEYRNSLTKDTEKENLKDFTKGNTAMDTLKSILQNIGVSVLSEIIVSIIKMKLGMQ